MSDDWRLRMQISGLVFVMLFVFWFTNTARADVGVTWPAPEGTHFRYGMTGSSAGGFTNCDAHQYNPSAFHDCARTIVEGTFCMAWRTPSSTWTGGPGHSDLYVIGDRGWQSACGEGWTRWYSIRQFVVEGPCPEGETCGYVPPPYECPAAGTSAGNSVYPLAGSVATCVDRGGGDTCAVEVSPVPGGEVTVLCMGNTCRQPIRYTGSVCELAGAPPAPDVAANNVTCVSMGGNLHCWHKDDVDCQRVNGESWCFSDVKVQPIITDGGQIVSTDAFSPVVDGVGDPVPPSSSVDVTEGASSITVEHYSSSTVISHSTSGPIAGNPAQGGGSGGPSGEGDGDEGGGGTASGGATCSDPPVCDGDPVGCAILAQNWRQRCVDDGNYLEGSGLSELGEGDSIFSALRDEDGDIQDVSDNLDSEGWLGASRECPSDVSLNFGEMVGMVTVPLSMLCPLLNLTGWLVMFFAGVASIRIIGGSV